MSDTASTWASIREGVNDVERLIGQKQYNLAMVKSRQTLETMVRALAERSGIEFTDLRDTIDALTEARVLSSSSADHYHKIRMIGNRAIHESDNNPTGANTAYHMLSQELTTFANEFAPKKGLGRWSRPAAAPQDSPVQNAAHSTSNRTDKKIELAFKVMIPVLVIILIVAVVNLIVKKNQTVEEMTEPEVQISVETLQSPPPTEPATEAEIESEVAFIITADKVNVRVEPNTECETLGQLNAGDEVEYISDYDEDWAEILYNGQPAYISKQFLNTRLTMSSVQVE